MKRRIALLVCFGLMACGGDDGGGGGAGDGADAGAAGATLEIGPGTAVLDVVNGAAATQDFTATLHREDGTTENVTASTVFTVDQPKLGGFQSATFTAQGLAGGKGLVTGTFEGVRGEALLVVNVTDVRVIDPAPADAADKFDAATDDPALAPAIVYPTNATIVPPNLGDFEVHWTGAGGADLFEVSLSSDYVNVRLYTIGAPNAGSFAAFLPDEWSVLGESLRGDKLTATVRGLVSASPATAGASTPIDIHLTEQDIQGGIYYWAARSSNGAPAGIYRHDMSRPGQPAEPFYTQADTPVTLDPDDDPAARRCVACHSLSRDGTRMALTYDGGNGTATVLDVATRTPVVPVDTYAWNFAAFTPDGSGLLTVHMGALTLRAPDTGAVITTVPTNGYVSHPDFAPNGAAITYVEVATPGQDWHFTGGNVVTQPFDPGTNTFGAASPLVTGAENIYYPSWSPDSQWIVFNKSTEDAYDDATAEIWVVKADGSLPPIKLDNPNVAAGLTNSWARWAPFEQDYAGSSESSEPLMWLTFSSKRAFGVRTPGGQPQIWMAPFFPQRATNGTDPSAPAFRLPMQDLGTNNHIAQWTEEIVPIE